MALIDFSRPLIAKNFALMAALALVTLPVFDNAALAKGKQTSHTTRRTGRSYFVPPPPPYAPSILPELQRQYGSQNVVAQATEDKLVESDSSDKYVKAKDGYQDPKAVRTNKYVTYWNQK